MAATKEEISQWFDRGVAQNATHMLVVCDTFNHEDYPVFCDAAEDALKEYARLDGPNMQRVMEVYYLNGNKKDQMDARRAMNFPPFDL